ncbi:McrC family protein [Mesorhizobium sp. CA15]|uniref:McrC family protein n=1 Tax=Mesorhizobium sp. CA15 TaxID=2876641 RepID=UPI001CD103D4|nr:McrC family protein [Mesorhizobium sp. CA15]MBZ9864225.1 McrC family protein [Mesorhizobium sp. CA15]
MIRRTIREWGYLPIDRSGEGEFTRTVADRLLELSRTNPLGGQDGECILTNHPHRLRAQQVVGMLAAPGVTLEILPKIDGADSDGATRRSLIHMLAAVIDLEIADGAITDLDWQKDDLLEILIRLFCDQLFKALHRGMPRQYVEHEDDLAAIRGRLVLKRQFTTLSVTPQKLACRFDELSPDIALNRIMKAALSRLSSIARSPLNQRRLAELAFAFSEISTVPVAQLPWDRVAIDRTNRAWAQPLELAKLLLGRRYQNTSGGEGRGFSLLFEMHTLFEEFVGRKVRQALSKTKYAVSLQGPTDHALTDYHSGRRSFLTRPDIIVSRDGNPVLIIDTKWKRLSSEIDDQKHGVSQADVYQLMAYAHVYRCDRLMLLYPHHNMLGREAGLIATHHIAGTLDTRLGFATFSLSQPRSAAEQCHGLIFNEAGAVNLPHLLAA